MAYYKETARIYGGSDMKNKVDLFNKKATDHVEKQLVNPFSGWDGASHSRKLDKSDVNYGRPVEGSKTEYRGKKAGQLINSEIITCCELIVEFGNENEDGTAWITFGELFEMYTRISNKLVGILMRARKHGLLHFEGEMLFQRRDDHVIIYMLMPIREIRKAAGLPEERLMPKNAPSTSM